MASISDGQRLVRCTRDRGINIQLARGGQLVKWRGPVGAMSEELESHLLAHNKDVEAYLKLGVANAAGKELNQHLIAPGIRQLQFLYCQLVPGSGLNSSIRFHRLSFQSNSMPYASMRASTAFSRRSKAPSVSCLDWPRQRVEPSCPSQVPNTSLRCSCIIDVNTSC